MAFQRLPAFFIYHDEIQRTEINWDNVIFIEKEIKRAIADGVLELNEEEFAYFIEANHLENEDLFDVLVLAHNQHIDTREGDLNNLTSLVKYIKETIPNTSCKAGIYCIYLKRLKKDQDEAIKLKHKYDMGIFKNIPLSSLLSDKPNTHTDKAIRVLKSHKILTLADLVNPVTGDIIQIAQIRNIGGKTEKVFILFLYEKGYIEILPDWYTKKYNPELWPLYELREDGNTGLSQAINSIQDTLGKITLKQLIEMILNEKEGDKIMQIPNLGALSTKALMVKLLKDGHITSFPKWFTNKFPKFTGEI